jgi:ubiquitin-conjugating enzyme E2 G1
MATDLAALTLSKQLKELTKNPVEGFSAGLVDDGSVFEWQLTIIGPQDTL